MWKQKSIPNQTPHLTIAVIVKSVQIFLIPPGRAASRYSCNPPPLSAAGLDSRNHKNRASQEELSGYPNLPVILWKPCLSKTCSHCLRPGLSERPDNVQANGWVVRWRVAGRLYGGSAGGGRTAAHLAPGHHNSQ